MTLLAIKSFLLVHNHVFHRRWRRIKASSDILLKKLRKKNRKKAMLGPYLPFLLSQTKGVALILVRSFKSFYTCFYHLNIHGAEEKTVYTWKRKLREDSRSFI